jgi:phage baseplate assembly protein W
MEQIMPNNTLYNRVTLPSSKSTNVARPQMYKGFSSINSKSKNFKLFDFELVKQDLINSFHVRQGERLMQPEIGCIIWDLLFEPLTEEVKELILQNVNDIVNSDPRISPKNVVVTQYETGIQIEMILVYVIYNLQENLQIQFDQANGLRSTLG